MRYLLLSLSAAALLTGCATPYQTSGLTGGLGEELAIGKLHTVTFFGNGYTNATLAQQYALYRCAEYAKSQNKPYFVMYSSLFGAAHNRPAKMPRVGTAGNFPNATAFVLVLDETVPGARKTDDVLEEYKATIETGKVKVS